MPSIGPYPLRNPYVLAPMAGVSEQPFRVLAFRMGAALCPTELVSAQGLMRANARTVRYLRHDPESLGYAAVIEWINGAVARPEDYSGQDPRFAVR